MNFFNELIKKIRSDKRWFGGTMAVLVTALVVTVLAIFMIPDVKANAIEDDPVGKTMTYNLPVIAAQNVGTAGVVEVNVDVSDPEYKYYIVGDGNTYNNISIVINYNLVESKVAPIYLDNVKIDMAENSPIIKFEPCTNENTNVNGSYKIIVKGDCELTSTCAGATYPVVQVESIAADLYQLKAYNGEDYLNVENYYDVVSSSFDVNVEFTAYEFADGEPKTECSLKVVTASGSYGAGIGTTAGTIDLSAENVVLADGTGTPINDLADGSLMSIFNKPLKVGAQALYGSKSHSGEITISGALKLTVIGNGYGACIGGGGSYNSTKNAKDAGEVTINGGTLYLDARAVNGVTIPAIGGGFNPATAKYGAANEVVITGGSVYIPDNNMAFGAFEAQPVNAAGQKLYLFEADYVDDVDDEGKLVISSERYEEKYKADIAVVDDYVTVDLEYNSSDFSQLLSYVYSGFGHDMSAVGNNLYFYLPASPLCSLTIDESSYLDSATPLFEISVSNAEIKLIDGVYWMPSGSEVVVTMKNIPSYIDVEKMVLTDVGTNVPTDYSSTFTYDEATGNYVVVLRVSSDSVFAVSYSSDIKINYDYGFVEGDSHNVTNNCPLAYDLGQELVINDSDVICDDLIFAGWYSKATGARITNINSSNLDSIMDDNGVIDLVAKWNVTVSYDMGEGTGEEIPSETVQYGVETNIVISNVVPELPYYIFEGWRVEGQLCSNGYVYTTIPTGNIVISASFVQSSFFVYVDASPKKFNTENVDIYVGLKGSSVGAANNLLIKNPDGTLATKEIDGVTYYYAVVEDEANIAMILTPKTGRVISGPSITITQGSGSQVSVGTGGSEDGEISVEFVISEDDVYISTQAEFVLRKYNMTFFDGTTAAGGEKLWPDANFTYTIENLQTPIGELIGERVDEIYSINGRFYEFAGWKDMLTGKVYSNEDALNENLGDIILVAQWNELEKVVVDTVVVDESDDSISDDVFAIPYYVDADGQLIEADIEEIDGGFRYYVMEDDKVVVKFYYYDNNGEMKDVTGGVVLRDMVLKYTKDTGSNTTEELEPGINYFICPMPKKGTSVKVTATVGIQEYTISYWDTKDRVHSNPTTYTFFDEIVLNNIYDNVGWLLVTADNDDGDYDDVKTTPITKIERGTVGNIVLKADWSNYIETSYSVQVDIEVKNGILEIVYPVGKDSYLPNETLIVKAIPDKGYVLKDNVILYRKVQPVQIYSTLLLNYGMGLTEELQDVTEITGSDGIYLVNMPEMNIWLTAIFEIEEYSITYREVGELVNDNVTTYTYFDTIELLPLEKDGYEFIGWKNEDGNIINKISGMTGDIELYPVFEKIETEEPETGEDDKEDQEGETEAPGTSDKDEKPSDNDGNKDDNTDKEDEEDGKVTIVDKNENVDDGSDKPEVETGKTHLVGGGNAYGSDTYTGDTSNVARLVLICVAAMLVLMIVVLYKGEDTEEKASKK